jgi:ribosomal protein S18 acetylase RimI-like enzyme
VWYIIRLTGQVPHRRQPLSSNVRPHRRSIMVCLRVIDHRDPHVASQVHALLQLAHAQESQLLGLDPEANPISSVGHVQTSNQFYLGAFDAEMLVGSASVEPGDEANQINIASLCVDPRYQRHGIGRSLVAEALRLGGSCSFSVATPARNAPALALYRSLGFVEHQHGTLGPGQLAMVKLRCDAA